MTSAIESGYAASSFLHHEAPLVPYEAEEQAPTAPVTVRKASYDTISLICTCGWRFV
jgi:hypothetical protein